MLLKKNKENKNWIRDKELLLLKKEKLIVKKLGIPLTLKLFNQLININNILYFPTKDGKIISYKNILLDKPVKAFNFIKKQKLYLKVKKQVFWIENYFNSMKNFDRTIRMYYNPYKESKNKFEVLFKYYQRELAFYKKEIENIDYLTNHEQWIDLEKSDMLSYNKWISKLEQTRRCILHFKSTNSNYFITLTDMKYKVLGSFTTGRFTPSNNKKRKMSPLLVYPLVEKIVVLLNEHKINHLILLLKSNITRHVYNTLWAMKKYDIIIDYIHFRKPIPHHYGQRRKKLRRI